MTAGSHTNADEKRCKITVLLHSPAALKLFLGVLVLFFFSSSYFDCFFWILLPPNQNCALWEESQGRHTAAPGTGGRSRCFHCCMGCGSALMQHKQHILSSSKHGHHGTASAWKLPWKVTKASKFLNFPSKNTSFKASEQNKKHPWISVLRATRHMPSCKIILQASWIAALSIKAELSGPTVYHTFYTVRGSSCLSRLRCRWRGETAADVWPAESPISCDGGRARSRLQVSSISEDKLATRDRKEAAWSEAVHRTSQGTNS